MNKAAGLYSVYQLGPSAFMIVALGLFFLGLWWKDRDEGLQWIGLSSLVAALFYGSEAIGLLPVPGALVAPAWAATVLCVAVGLLVVGLSMYVDPGWARSRLTYMALLPAAVLLVLVLSGIPVPRVWGNSLFVLPYAVLSWVVWRARIREPKAGYELLALTLLALPVAYVVMLIIGADVVLLRSVAVFTRLLVFITLLVVCLHRRRVRLDQALARSEKAERDLVIANEVLEQKVADRTADLQSLVMGLESFNRNVSHDLRGPLGGISGLAQLAWKAFDAGDRAQAERMLKLIEQQAGKATDLTSALLDLAKMSHANVERRPVEMDGVVSDIFADLSLRQSFPMPAVAIGSMPVAQADAKLVRIILTNLVSNACKFLAGRPDGRIEIGSQLAGTEVAYFIKDNGPGFDMAAASRLFEPFQRLHAGQFSGHGLGLSIVKRAIERHGGRVWAEGSPKRGAAFYFTLGGVG